jgi:hypothetical protein
VGVGGGAGEAAVAEEVRGGDGMVETEGAQREEERRWSVWRKRRGRGRRV